MGFKSDVEITQKCKMIPITEIAAKADIDKKYLEQYSKYKEKIDYNLLKEPDKQDDQTKLGIPTDLDVTAYNLKLSAGAGFIVALTDEIMPIPSLQKVPVAEKSNVDENGKITGLICSFCAAIFLLAKLSTLLLSSVLRFPQYLHNSSCEVRLP